MNIYILSLLTTTLLICHLTQLAHAANKNNLLLTATTVIAATRVAPDSETVTWAGREWQRSDDGKLYTWQEAQDYCNNLVLEGYDDWHLPSKDELKTIVVCTNGTPTPLQDPFTQPPTWCGDGNSEPFDIPTISKLFSCHSESYWTATDSGYPGFAYRVSFADGGVFESKASNTHYVRCVRQ